MSNPKHEPYGVHLNSDEVCIQSVALHIAYMIQRRTMEMKGYVDYI